MLTFISRLVFQTFNDLVQHSRYTRNSEVDREGKIKLLPLPHSFAYIICPFASCMFTIAEPTRQPTTKRRKRKNSTSSTSNSSAGTNTNSTTSKKKTAAANLSLSSQVPVSPVFLLGLHIRLSNNPYCKTHQLGLWGSLETLFRRVREILQHTWGGVERKVCRALSMHLKCMHTRMCSQVFSRPV